MAVKKAAESTEDKEIQAGEITLDALAAEIARLKAELTAVKAREENEGAAKRTPPAEVRPAISQERVRIKLFKDSGKYASDVFVGVNGVGYQIKRGVLVEVPKTVADILEQSMAQDEATSMMIEQAEQAYQDTL